MRTESSLLPADWDVPAALRARLGTTAGRQRILDGAGHLIVVLHAPPGADDAERRGRFFWRDPSGQWRAAPKAERVSSLEDHLNDFRTAIERLEQAEDAAHEARDYFELLDRVAPMARSIRNMYEALQQARETMPDDRRLIVARDQAYDLTRRADLLQNDAKNGLDFAVAWQAEQQAENSYQMAVSAYRLNLLVAFFFPIATLSALFGANLGHGFEHFDQQNAPLTLVALIAAGLFFGFVLTGFITRPARRPNAQRGSNDIARRTSST